MSRHVLAVTMAVWTLAGCHEVVLTARPESEANLALETLYSVGLEPRKRASTRGRFDVTVPAASVGDAVAALRGAGLPRERGLGLADFLAEPGLVPSEFEEVARYHQALSGDIEASLIELPDVRDARVHLAVAPPSGVRRAPQPERVRSASVLLFRVGHARAPTTDVEEVRALVAGAVAGLDPGAVSVVEAGPAHLATPRPAPAPGRSSRVVGAAAVSVIAGLGLTVAALARRRRPSSPPEPELDSAGA